MNLATILKMKKGGIGPEQLTEMLEAMGIKAQFSPVPKEEALPAFQRLAVATERADTSLLSLTFTMKDGKQFEGLLVLMDGHTGP